MKIYIGKLCNFVIKNKMYFVGFEPTRQRNKVLSLAPKKRLQFEIL